MSDEKCIGCDGSLLEGEGEHRHSTKKGCLCESCVRSIINQDMKLEVSIIPHQRDDYAKKWIRDLHIKNLRLYSVGSEVLMVIGHLLESFWNAEKEYGNTNVDWVSSSANQTDRDCFEKWLMLWHSWIAEGRCCGDEEAELYKNLPDILHRAWD